jgi:hypothetical protein
MPNQTFSATTLVTRNTFIESNNYHLVLQNTRRQARPAA